MDVRSTVEGHLHQWLLMRVKSGLASFEVHAGYHWVEIANNAYYLD